MSSPVLLEAHKTQDPSLHHYLDRGQGLVYLCSCSCLVLEHVTEVVHFCTHLGLGYLSLGMDTHVL